MDLAHQVQRPALDLVVDAANVLAENADTHELHAAEKQDRDDGGRVAVDHLDAEHADAEQPAADEGGAIHHGDEGDE